MIGRPPKPHWDLPNAEIVFCGERAHEAELGFAGRLRGVVVPNTADLEQLLCALAQSAGSGPTVGHPAWQFDAVYCDYEHALVNAAVLARLTGATRAMSVERAILGRDKWRQKELARAAGIPTADGQVVWQPPTEAPALQPPLVVKPLLGSAARAVRRYDDASAALERIRELTAAEPALVEGFVTGPECHIDVIVADGRLALLSVGFYLTNIMSTGRLRPIGSCLMPQPEDPELYRRAEELAARVATAFGMTDGVLHLEAFDGAQGLVFSECGFRRSGGKTPETVALSTGVDYRQLACLATLRLLDPRPTVYPSSAAAWVMVKSPPGRIVSLPAEADFTSVPGLVEVHADRSKRGQVAKVLQGPYERVGHVVVAAPGSVAAIHALEQATSIFQAGIEVVPDDDAS